MIKFDGLSTSSQIKMAIGDRVFVNSLNYFNKFSLVSLKLHPQKWIFLNRGDYSLNRGKRRIFKVTNGQ